MSEYENTVMMRKMLAEHDYNKVRELEQENESLRKENELLLLQLNKAKANFAPYNTLEVFFGSAMITLTTNRHSKSLRVASGTSRK